MKDKLIAILDDIDEDIARFDGEDLFDAGIIDSFDVIEIVNEMEKAFDVEISADDVIGKNFRTVESMLALIESIVKRK